MSESKRVIIGSETDDTKKVSLIDAGLVPTVPVTIINSSGNAVNPMASLINFNFNRIDQSLTALTDVYTYYNNGVLQATITVYYPDNLKDNWTSIIKT